MKKFKINVYQAANIAYWVSLLEYLLYFAAFWTVCDTSPVAGLTVSYQGYVLWDSGLQVLRHQDDFSCQESARSSISVLYSKFTRPFACIRQ